MLTLDAPTGLDEVEHFMPYLQRALDGDGPPILTLPAESSDFRSRLISMANSKEGLERDDIALVVATSGSTGLPKLAMLSGSAVTASVDATHRALGAPGRWLLMVPTSHIAGLQVLTRSALSGFAPAVLDLSSGFRTDRFVSAVGRLLQVVGSEPRYTSLVPTQLRRILDAGGAAVAGLAALDGVLIGGSAPSPHLIERAQDERISLVTSYGLTETCGGCVYDGLPLERVTVDIGPGGRIEIRGPMLFSGYHGDPELTAAILANGTLRTNDLGSFDQEGRLQVHGRLDDVIITGGLNGSSSDVESVLSEHPSISDVAVVGVADDEWGNQIVAVAVVDGQLNVGAVQGFAQQRLERHAVPRRLVIVDALPMLTAGKPDRAAIRALAAQPRTGLL